MNIAVIASWETFKYHESYYLPYSHYVYINFICKHFKKVYLIVPVLTVYNLKKDYHPLNFRNLIVKELPYFRKYMEGMKLFKYYFKIINSINDADVFYCRVPDPYCWIPRLLFGKKSIMHYVGDTIEATLANERINFAKRMRYILFYLPEYFLSLLASKYSNVFTNGFHIHDKLKSLTIKSHPLISSTLGESDFYRRKVKFKKDEIRFLYVGYIRYSKGLEALLEIITIFEENGLSANLDIIGDGEFKRELMEIVRSKGLHENVIFHGHIDDRNRINNFYRKSDIFLFPSLSEGSPRVVLEAMANSLPVVSTPIGSLPYVFDNDIHLKFAKPNNATSFAAKISEYINDEKTTQLIVDNAFEKVKNEFTLKKFLSPIFVGSKHEA